MIFGNKSCCHLKPCISVMNVCLESVIYLDDEYSLKLCSDHCAQCSKITLLTKISGVFTVLKRPMYFLCVCGGGGGGCRGGIPL